VKDVCDGRICGVDIKVDYFAVPCPIFVSRGSFMSKPCLFLIVTFGLLWAERGQAHPSVPRFSEHA